MVAVVSAENLTIVSTIKSPSRHLTKEKRPLIRYGVIQRANGNSCRSNTRCFLGEVVHLWFQVDPIFASILWARFKESDCFCLNFTLWIINQWNSETNSFGINSADSKLRNTRYFKLYHTTVKSRGQHLYLKLNVNLELLCPSALDITPDIRWCKRLKPLLIEFMILNDIMSWLSTLGGAYSSLGEQNMTCSHKAGSISRHQLLIAMKLNNPILVAQCKVFLAMSMVQRGHLKTAIKIIRQQYAHAKNGFEDSKLIASCKAVWNKIRYVKQLKVRLKDSNPSDAETSRNSKCT